jgi:hypothetical protein
VMIASWLPPLARPWWDCVSPEGKHFFWNEDTGRTTWYDPRFVAADGDGEYNSDECEDSLWVAESDSDSELVACTRMSNVGISLKVLLPRLHTKPTLFIAFQGEDNRPENEKVRRIMLERYRTRVNRV